MISRSIVCTCTLAGLLLASSASHAQVQKSDNPDDIPLERCDRLPIVTVQIDKKDMRFLVDTAATTFLNLNSFATGKSKDVQITSWSGTAATSAREVSLPELSLGTRHLRDLKLPAVDLSSIAKACGGRIDGILGVDILEKLGMTIDLQRRIARLGPAESAADETEIANMQSSMHSCTEAFNRRRKEELAVCFDKDLVLNTPWAELRGRERVAEYIRETYFSLDPPVELILKVHDQRAVKDVVWTSYDYNIGSAEFHLTGRGMMVCRRSGEHWQILSMHNDLTGPDPRRKP